MSVTYPIPLASFIQKYKIRTIELDLVHQSEMSNQASGGRYWKNLGPSYWVATITTSMIDDVNYEEVLALLRALQITDGTFLCTNMRRRFPKLDPAGSTLGASTVQINSVSSNQISLKGLPAAYALSLGDYLSVDYGSPTEHILFQMLEPVTANGSGVTGLFAVAPDVPAAMAVNNAVVLKNPVCQMCVIDNSIQRSDGFLFSSLVFKAVESRGA